VNWQRHIGRARGTVPAIVIGSEPEGNILFILPLAVYTTGPVRRLRWLGSQLCDYNGPVLARHFPAWTSTHHFRSAWHDVIELLRRDALFHFDVIDLAKMPESIGEQRNPFMDFRLRAHPSGAYLASLGRDWETFYAGKRSAATRKRERRQLRQLAEHGEVRFRNVESTQEIERTLTTLFQQKSDAFARMGVDDAFARPGQREFFLAVAKDPAMSNIVHVSRLDVGNEMAATSIGLKHRGCYYLILSSYTPGTLSRFGPGRAQLNELMGHAIRQGIHEFDFTVGDEPYKRDWSDRELMLHDHLTAVTLRGWLFVAMLTTFRRIKRGIKQSPLLWRGFSRARALAGVLNSR
jgi:CelD/BcsL family acetyltransferase involved in cellulose biosynthesis